MIPNSPSPRTSPWLAPVVAFDLLPPGSRSVTHTLTLERCPAFDAYDFVAAPVQGFAGVTPIQPGTPFTFSSKYGTRIYALEKGGSLPDVRDSIGKMREAYAAAARAVGEIPVQELHHVPIASPVESADTLLRVVAVENGVVRLAVVEHHERWGTLHSIVIVALVAVGALGLVALFRARRRRAAAEVA